MRLARLALAGLALGIVVGFIAALLRPRLSHADETMLEQPIQSLTQGDEEPIGWGTRPEPRGRGRRAALPPLVPAVARAKPQGPVD